MLNLYTLATKPGALTEQLHIPLYTDYQPVYQARPGMLLPMICLQNDQAIITSGRWGYATEPRTMPTYAFPMEKILSQSPYNRWIHTQRCLIPVNCFFGRASHVSTIDDSDIYLIRMLSTRLFFIGALYSIEINAIGKSAYHFILLTTESADVLKPLMDQMPVVMIQDHLQTWLGADHLIDIMHLADRSGDHWFDYYAVDHDIITPGNNRRDLLKPLGASLREKEERDHKLKAIDVKQERFDRRGGKW